MSINRTLGESSFLRNDRGQAFVARDSNLLLAVGELALWFIGQRSLHMEAMVEAALFYERAYATASAGVVAFS